MQHWAVYDRVSGTILRSGFCTDPAQAAAQARAGEAVILSDTALRDDHHAVDITKKPPALYVRAIRGGK